MQVVHARAAVTTSEMVDESLTTIVARSVLEAALKEDQSAELWFDLANEDGEDAGRNGEAECLCGREVDKRTRI